MNELYFESGYLEASYFGTLAVASSGVSFTAGVSAQGDIASTTGYYIPDYIAVDYFESELIVGNAVLVASFASVSAVNKTVSANAVFAVIFTQTATITNIEGTDLFAFSNAAIAVQVSRLRDNNIAATSVFSVATDVRRIRRGDSDSNAIFSAIINGLRSRDVNLTTQAAFSFVCAGNKIILPSISITAAFNTNRPYVEDGYVDIDYSTNFVTVANFIVNNLQQLSAVSSMFIDADFSAQGAALLANGGTLTTNPVKKVSAASNQSVVVSTNFNPVKKVIVSATAQSAFTLVANVGTQSEIFLTAFSNGALTTTARKIVSPVLNNNAVSTFFADTEDSLTIRGEANLSAAFTSSAAIRKITGFGAVLQASGFTVTVGTTSKAQGASLSSVFSVGATARVIRNGVATLSLTSSVSISGIRTRRITATISSALTFVVAVRELRLDAIVYVIPAEGWTYRIEGETRLHTIISESRVKEIVGESRLHTINGESRIHII